VKTMIAPARLLAALRASQNARDTTVDKALTRLWMAVMEYFHAHREIKIPQYILILVQAMQDSAKNAPDMQILTLMTALQSLSCDEIACDRKVAAALAVARAALVSEHS
jgi:hypothetical protein